MYQKRLIQAGHVARMEEGRQENYIKNIIVINTVTLEDGNRKSERLN